MFKRLDPFGNPNVGVYVRATSRHLFVGPHLTQQNRDDLKQALGLEPVEAFIAGSPLVGSLVAANAKGAVIANVASDEEVAVFEKAGLSVLRLPKAKLNAAGNNVLCNDHGAIVHPDMPERVIGQISEVLGVPAHASTVGGLPTVGAAAAATNHGVLVHPLASEGELAFIKKALLAPARIGTVNHGHGLVGAGLAANQNGFAVGSRTTGIELGRIDDALGFGAIPR